MQQWVAVLVSAIRISAGRLFGNGRWEQIGRAELAQAKARRKAESAIRPASNRFRVGVGQKTLQEQLAARVATARLHEQGD